MSSAYIAHDNINDGIAFFRAVADLSGNVVASVDANQSVSSIMTITDFEAATTYNTSLTSGTLLRDMGKVVTIVDATTGIHTQVWRRVQVVSGGASEGVQASPSDLYVLTWVAGPAGLVRVKVVRTG